MIGLLTTVNCSASVSRFIAAEVEKRGLLRDFPTIDGIVALTHTSGCAMPIAGEGFELLRRTILGYANHPNFGGVLLLSLGCETNELQGLLEDPRLRHRGPASRARHPGGGWHAGDRPGRASTAIDRAAAGDRGRRAGAGPRERAHRGHGVRWLRRLLGHLGQSGRGPCLGPDRLAGRHGGVRGDAGDLRRGAPAGRTRSRSPGRPAALRPRSLGGSATPRATAARWTATRHRATRPAVSRRSSRSRWAPSPRAARPTSSRWSSTRSRCTGRVSSSWTRRATTRCQRPASSPAAPRSCASRRDAARCSAASQCPSIKVASNTPMYAAHARRHGRQRGPRGGRHRHR